jgi:hypothetical protein
VRRVAFDDARDADAPEPPPGTVEVSLYSEPEQVTWNVAVDGQDACQTPCVQVIRPDSHLTLATRRVRLDVPTVAPFLGDARYGVVVAELENPGLMANGIVWTTLGGMGLVTAITLTAVGCSDFERRGGVCTAGLITGAVALPLTAAAIGMLVGAGPTVHILPVKKGQPAVSLLATPTGVAGTF